MSVPTYDSNGDSRGLRVQSAPQMHLQWAPMGQAFARTNSVDEGTLQTPALGATVNTAAPGWVRGQVAEGEAPQGVGTAYASVGGQGGCATLL